MKTKILSLFILVVISATSLTAQCDCDFTLQTYHPVRNEFRPADLPGYKPGDVICLESGDWKSTVFIDIQGSATEPVIIQNCDGLVHLTGQYVGIQFEGCQYIKLTGTGDPNETYGIRVDSMPSGTSGISVAELSSDIEIEYVEVGDFLAPGGSGIIAKTDPDCANPMTWRGNFTLRNILIHNNYIHDTGDEGLYIGYTGGFATSKKFCGPTETFGHLIEHVEIYENIIERTGRDGLQVSLCTLDLTIRNNFIMHYGDNGGFDQNFGLSVGSGSRGRVYGNTVIQSPTSNAVTSGDINSRGISVLNSLPPVYIYNNVVIAPAGPGIWMHQRLDMAGRDTGWYAINNTIIKPGNAGIFYNSTIPSTPNDQEDWDNGFYNNVIVNPGVDYSSSGFWKGVPEEYIDYNKKIQRDNGNASHNYVTDDLESLLFFDTTIANQNFKIDTLSPAINYGRDVRNYGIVEDFEGRPRFVSGGDTIFDAGAYEFTKAKPITGIKDPNAEKDFKVYPNPAGGSINISIDLDRGGQAKVRIMDFRGAKLAENTFKNLQTGTNNLTMDLNDVHFKGAALLVVFTGEKTRTRTIIIE